MNDCCGFCCCCYCRLGLSITTTEDRVECQCQRRWVPGAEPDAPLRRPLPQRMRPLAPRPRWTLPTVGQSLLRPRSSTTHLPLPPYFRSGQSQLLCIYWLEFRKQFVCWNHPIHSVGESSLIGLFHLDGYNLPQLDLSLNQLVCSTLKKINLNFYHSFDLCQAPLYLPAGTFFFFFLIRKIIMSIPAFSPNTVAPFSTVAIARQSALCIAAASIKIIKIKERRKLSEMSPIQKDLLLSTRCTRFYKQNGKEKEVAVD